MKRLFMQIFVPSMSEMKGRPQDMTWNIGTMERIVSEPDGVARAQTKVIGAVWGPWRRVATQSEVIRAGVPSAGEAATAVEVQWQWESGGGGGNLGCLCVVLCGVRSWV